MYVGESKAKGAEWRVEGLLFSYEAMGRTGSQTVFITLWCANNQPQTELLSLPKHIDSAQDPSLLIQPLTPITELQFYGCSSIH